MRVPVPHAGDSVGQTGGEGAHTHGKRICVEAPTVEIPGRTSRSPPLRRTFDPYLGGYDHMLAVGRDFYGIFCASNGQPAHGCSQKRCASVPAVNGPKTLQNLQGFSCFGRPKSAPIVHRKHAGTVPLPHRCRRQLALLSRNRRRCWIRIWRSRARRRCGPDKDRLRTKAELIPAGA
jgi:hypothetical protein